MDSLDRLRKKIETTRIHLDTGDISITFSLGIASANGEDDITLDLLLARADEALYDAKKGGRNRVRIWQDLRA